MSAAVLCAIALSGCTGVERPAPSASASASPSASSPSEDEPADPTLIAGGTADDNLAYFDLVNTRFLAADPMPGGRAIIDNLVAAGFDKTAMQVTPDETSIGRDVDAVEFSVQFGDRCLIGQASASGYVGTTGKVIPSAGCLLGTTRAIDW